jgi:diketogulonate reductase-like aldo/keto reductase
LARAIIATKPLAWLLAQHEWIVPIPGTTKLYRLQENVAAANFELIADDLQEITAVADQVAVQAAAADHGSTAGKARPSSRSGLRRRSSPT